MNANSDVCAPSTRITWKIDNFSKINSISVYSDVFCVDGYNWKFGVYPKGNNVNYLSMYLHAVDDSKVLPIGWSIKADFILSLINQLNVQDSIKKELVKERIFTAKGSSWGFPRFIPLSDFNDPSKGYLVNDSCVVEADIWVSNPKGYETWPTKLQMAKIDIGGEEIKVTKAEIMNRAKAVTLLASSITSGTNLLVRSEASLMADPKIGSDISSSLLLLNDEKQMSAKGMKAIAEEAKSGLVQAVARQEFLIRKLLNKEDKVKNAETEVNRFKKEVEQYTTELMEVKAKRSDLESEVEQLRNSLTEEKRARKEAESIVASMAELKEKCLDVYSAGYMACEKEMKRLAVEKGFLDLLPDLDDDESTNGMEKIKEAKTEKYAEDKTT